jgi:hypothetical protein
VVVRIKKTPLLCSSEANHPYCLFLLIAEQ